MARARKDRGFNTIGHSAAEAHRKTKTLQKYTLFAIVGLAAITAALLIALAIGGIVDTARGHRKRVPSDPTNWNDVQVTSKDTQCGSLILVNQTHPYTFPQNEEHLGKIYDTRARHPKPAPYALGGEAGSPLYMEKTALEALDRMLTDFAEQSKRTNVFVREAYRTSKREEELNKEWAGKSDHHTGLGCELRYLPEGGTQNFDLFEDPAYNWIFENAHRYGFVVRYPSDKSEQTGVEKYAGYFRYVGVPHATYMVEQHLCLEEYVEQLKDYTWEHRLAISGADGQRYEVYCAKVDRDVVRVHCPSDFDYSLSGNNDGYVVVTVNCSVQRSLAGPAETAEAGGTAAP